MKFWNLWIIFFNGYSINEKLTNTNRFIAR